MCVTKIFTNNQQSGRECLSLHFYFQQGLTAISISGKYQSAQIVSHATKLHCGVLRIARTIRQTGQINVNMHNMVFSLNHFKAEGIWGDLVLGDLNNIRWTTLSLKKSKSFSRAFGILFGIIVWPQESQVSYFFLIKPLHNLFALHSVSFLHHLTPGRPLLISIFQKR